jgi:cation transporter-like permease
VAIRVAGNFARDPRSWRCVFALKRLGFDPATASAPFVATLVDVSGLVIYFRVAYLVLRGTLL